jgi:cob(I)alamin adenosyltransferase
MADEDIKNILQSIQKDIIEMKEEITQVKRHLKQVRKQIDKLEENDDFMINIYKKYESTIVFAKSKIDKLRKNRIFSNNK